MPLSGARLFDSVNQVVANASFCADFGSERVRRERPGGGSYQTAKARLTTPRPGATAASEDRERPAGERRAEPRRQDNHRDAGEDRQHGQRDYSERLRLDRRDDQNPDARSAAHSVYESDCE